MRKWHCNHITELIEMLKGQATLSCRSPSPEVYPIPFELWIYSSVIFALPLTCGQSAWLLFYFGLFILCRWVKQTLKILFPNAGLNKRSFVLRCPQTTSWSLIAFHMKTEAWWKAQQVRSWEHLKLGHLFSKGSSYIRSLPERRYQRAGEKSLFFYVTQDWGGEGGL